MRTVPKNMIFFSFLLLAACSLIMPVSAADNSEDLTDYNNAQNITADEIRHVIDVAMETEYNFDFLMNGTHSENVVSVFGTAPQGVHGMEAYNNWVSMDNISQALANDDVFQKYLYSNGGAILGQGTQSVCYISIVVFNEEAENFLKNDLLTVKARVDHYAALEGIQNVPLVFFKGNMSDSYLSEEQLLYLYDSGYEGLTITDGLENLTALRSQLGTVSMASETNYAFDDIGLSESPSLIDRIKFMFKSSPEPMDLSSLSTFEGMADEKVRPIVGGVMIATSTSGGTVGFAAKDVNNPDVRGIVTVGHVFHFENKTSYQPRQGYGDGNTIGTFSKINKSIDSVFIPTNASDVKAGIYTGEGDDQLLDVVGYDDAVASGMPLSKSGVSSGNTNGTYFGIRYNQTFTVKNGTINYTVAQVGMIQESSVTSYSIPGDSGGPIYVKIKETVNGTEQDVAVLLGILEGGDGNGIVYYVPCSEIQARLGVVPLTIYD
ncbi:MAG: S1 family peptidase [Methanosarcinales archaeon]|jgi:hypothetical protein|nr:S1 family peptidase [Methanosarcinales archaeon]